MQHCTRAVRLRFLTGKRVYEMPQPRRPRFERDDEPEEHAQRRPNPAEQQETEAEAARLVTMDDGAQQLHSRQYAEDEVAAGHALREHVRPEGKVTVAHAIGLHSTAVARELPAAWMVLHRPDGCHLRAGGLPCRHQHGRRRIGHRRGKRGE